MENIVPSGKTFFYERKPVKLDEYTSEALISIPFTPTKIIIKPMALGEKEIVSFSFRKPELHGEFDCADDALVMDDVTQHRIWAKTNIVNSDAQLRVWAWRGGGA